MEHKTPNKPTVPYTWQNDYQFKMFEAQNYLNVPNSNFPSLPLMAHVSNGAYLVRLSNVLAEGKLGKLEGVWEFRI